jgi:mono/diheme cytochrome c family protein
MQARSALAAAVALALLFASSPAWTQTAKVEKLQMRAIASVDGRTLFGEYCAPCHGVDGKGQGRLAAQLRVPPPDLTTIAIRHGGKLDAGAIEDRINGWKQIPRTMGEAAKQAHTRDTGEDPENMPVMPSFGPIFASLYRQEGRDRQIRMTNLVRYGKSLQVTAPGEGER